MEEKPSHLIPSLDCADVVARSFRDLPPAHYILKIDSFSYLQQLLSKTGAKSYKSKIFEASGYKWKLSLYPNGDEERNGKGHISMYLVIQATKTLPLAWEVNVNFKLFVFDQIRGKYLTIQDAQGEVRRFDEMKIEWGFPQLLLHGIFYDSSNGYLISDKCVFGAEILVISRTGKGECLTHSTLKDVDGRHTWKISQFSTFVDNFHCSDIFTLGNFKWKLVLYPSGNSSGAGNFLSLFFTIVDLKASDTVDVECKLSIQNQKGSEDKESRGHCSFTASCKSWGFPKLLSLSDLKDTSKGFLVNDSLIVEVQITDICAVQSFS